MSPVARVAPAGRWLGRLRTAALAFVVLGAVGSVVLELIVGRHNSSGALLVMFAGWILSPFVALGIADRLSTRWTALTRTTLHCVMLIIPLVSLTVYGNVAFGPPRPQPAAMFLIVPAASLLFMAAALGIATRVHPNRQA